MADAAQHDDKTTPFSHNLEESVRMLMFSKGTQAELAKYGLHCTDSPAGASSQTSSGWWIPYIEATQGTERNLGFPVSADFLSVHISSSENVPLPEFLYNVIEQTGTSLPLHKKFCSSSSVKNVQMFLSIGLLPARGDNACVFSLSQPKGAKTSSVLYVISTPFGTTLQFSKHTDPRFRRYDPFLIQHDGQVVDLTIKRDRDPVNTESDFGSTSNNNHEEPIYVDATKNVVHIYAIPICPKPPRQPIEANKCLDLPFFRPLPANYQQLEQERKENLKHFRSRSEGGILTKEGASPAVLHAQPRSQSSPSTVWQDKDPTYYGDEPATAEKPLFVLDESRPIHCFMRIFEVTDTKNIAKVGVSPAARYAKTFHALEQFYSGNL